MNSINAYQQQPPSSSLFFFLRLPPFSYGSYSLSCSRNELLLGATSYLYSALLSYRLYIISTQELNS
jgi:hypothetical protein